jgi:hypothetical protein
MMAITYTEDTPGELDEYLGNVITWAAQGGVEGERYNRRRKLAKDSGGTQVRFSDDAGDYSVRTAKDMDKHAAWDTVRRLAKGMDKQTWDEIHTHANDGYSGGENLAPRGSSTAGSAVTKKSMQAYGGGTRGSNTPYTAADEFYAMMGADGPIPSDTMGMPENPARSATPTAADTERFNRMYIEGNV